MQYGYFDSEDNNRKSFELPGAKPHYNPDRPGQVSHIALDLTLDIPQQSFQGTATLTLLPVRRDISQLSLDAVDLKIDAVLIEQVSQPFDHDGEKLTIHLLQPTQLEVIQIAITYHVQNPQRGLYFIQPDDHYPHKPIQVWTQGEDEDSRFWFPCFDYPGQLATSEIRVTVAKPYRAISNGALIAIADHGSDRTYHWSQQQIHPTYLMTLAVGDFAELVDDWQGIPVTYYVEKGKEAQARLSMGKTPQMIEFFSEKFGYPYPYPKYAQVCVDDFIFGGMENTSTTLLTDRCLLDERAAIDNLRTESLVAHELAHQWFGDLVVIKHWSHAWIKEGMASYAEVLWTEQEYGKDDAAYYLLGEARSYLEEDASRYRRPIVTHVYREAIELYDRHLYEKGACVYHMIRGILGDELFDRFVQTFVQDHAHQTVETIDLLRAIEKATGYNLLFLFDQYVYRGGHPDFKVAYSWDSENKVAKLMVTQTQAKDNGKGKITELFDLKIPFAFNFLTPVSSTTPGSPPISTQTVVLRLNEKEQSFYFPLARKPDFVSFDQGNYFLKTVELDYPIADLTQQVQHDPDPVSRIYAAIALGKKGNLAVIKTLQERLTQEPVWGVKVEIAEQLGKIQLDQAFEALKVGLQDPDAKVRRAVIAALSEFKTLPSLTLIQTTLLAGDASYVVEATCARCLGSMVTGQLQTQTEAVIATLKQILETRSGWNEVVRAGAIAGLSRLKTSPMAVDIIADYTALGIPQALRLAAIRALGTVSTGQTPDKLQVILDRLSSIAQESFFLTQVAVSGALGQMETPQAIAILQSLAERTPDGRARRLAEEAIAKVRKKLGSDQELKALREDIDKLKQENQAIKSQLEELKAK